MALFSFWVLMMFGTSHMKISLFRFFSVFFSFLLSRPLGQLLIFKRKKKLYVGVQDPEFMSAFKNKLVGFLGY